MSASSIPSDVDLRGRALLYVCDLMLVAVILQTTLLLIFKVFQ